MHELDAAHGLQCCHGRGKAPGKHFVAHGLLKALDPASGHRDGIHIFLEGDLLSGLRQLQFGEPAQVSRGPGSFAYVANVVSEQQRF